MQKPMICVPIIGRTQDEILEKAQECAQLPIELVEWRIDFYEQVAASKKVISLAAKIRKILGDMPLLITFRSLREGGDANGATVMYQVLLDALLKEKICDYIDIEMFYNKEIALGLLNKAYEAEVKVIGSYHDFAKTPSDEEMIARLLEIYEMGADFGKIAVMPSNAEDVERLLAITEEVSGLVPDFPIITMAMGELGRMTRLYGGLYGSTVTFGCCGEPSAPGQIPVEELKQTLSLIHGEKKHIILIGFMGVGKTSVSQELSSLSGKKEVDTDQLIVQVQGRTIADIFQAEGEAFFRDLETEILDRFGAMEPCIISCGGGMALRELNRKKMKAIGTVVWLTATKETIYDRVKDFDTRPLLNGNMNPEYIGELMDKRSGFYEKAAELVVSVDEKDVNAIAKEILAHFS